MKLFGKKSKVLAAAIAMMTLSTAAAVTGTVAWFTANNVVSVTGPTIMAEAEQGIVIANETHAAASDWGTAISASHLGSYEENSTKKYYSFVPTSTRDGATWYHNNSNNMDNYAAANAYDSFAGTASTNPSNEGLYDATVNGSSKHIYLLNQFWIQSVDPSNDLLNQDIFVKEITANVIGSNSAALNKTLRVLFKTSTTSIIYAPLATGTEVVHDGNATADGKGGLIGGSGNAALTVYKAVNATSAERDRLFSDVTIGKYTVGGTDANVKQISVYAYFEGEDFNCKSSNIVASLDKLSISFKFENKDHITSFGG